MKSNEVLGITLFGIGLIIVLFIGGFITFSPSDGAPPDGIPSEGAPSEGGLFKLFETMFIAGAGLCVFGALISIGWLVRSIKFGQSEIQFQNPSQFRNLKINKKVLDESVLDERKKEANEYHLPDDDVGPYSPFDPDLATTLKLNPSNFSRVPMYLLDKSFRIIDWNEAMSLVFDRTMEGRIGESVREWTMYLDNWQEVTEHGAKIYGETANWPNVDVETIHYTSDRYGPIKGKKRAYAMPADDGRVIGFLVVIEAEFSSVDASKQYQFDIVRLLETDLMWSEYALLYDELLPLTKAYRELLDVVLGIKGQLSVPQQGARILDLGAGTGNIALKLAQMDKGFHIVAVENNRMMIDSLFEKVRGYEKASVEKPGVNVIRQNITSLFGIDDNCFDLVILNNVLYSVDDYRKCLREVLRVLKPGGEVRITGPHRHSNADRLFSEMQRDLTVRGKFNDVEWAFNRAMWINRNQLLPLAHKWTKDELVDILTNEIGFGEVLHAGYDLYYEQSMLVSARK